VKHLMQDPTPDIIQDTLARAFDAYAAELEQLTPSADLDRRMLQAIDRELSQRQRRHRWQPSAKWAIAASLALLASVTVLPVRDTRFLPITGNAVAPTAAPQPAVTADAMQVFPAGAVSLWPTEATVFRVRSSFGTPTMEQQYWLDVRIANDGSMRIERVLSADGSELFARPGINP
jgi:hypothetical protein